MEEEIKESDVPLPYERKKKKHKGKKKFRRTKWFFEQFRK